MGLPHRCRMGLPQILRGSDATPTQPVIYSLNLPSVQWREDWRKAFLATVKHRSLLWLTTTQGPSFLGSLPVATLVKAMIDQGSGSQGEL